LLPARGGFFENYLFKTNIREQLLYFTLLCVTVRIILIAKEHEYLVLEAFPLICDKLEFSFNKYCDESFLINDETPKELIIVVRNAEIELKNIHFSENKLNTAEESNFQSNKVETKN